MLIGDGFRLGKPFVGNSVLDNSGHPIRHDTRDKTWIEYTGAFMVKVEFRDVAEDGDCVAEIVQTTLTCRGRRLRRCGNHSRTKFLYGV